MSHLEYHLHKIHPNVHGDFTLKIALKHSVKVLFRVPMYKKAVMCLTRAFG